LEALLSRMPSASSPLTERSVYVHYAVTANISFLELFCQIYKKHRLLSLMILSSRRSNLACSAAISPPHDDQ
jgi:hypothetical protein